MYIITMDVCIRLGVLEKGEKYTSEDTKTKIIFVVGQWVYMFLMLIPVPIFFYVRLGDFMSYLRRELSPSFLNIAGSSTRLFCSS